jgi:quercetin 2,3-dioxygenase
MDHVSGTFEPLPSRDLSLGDLHVSRALPARSRRTVGPWCFLDRFGPLTFAEGKPMDVAPHPHIGMQTVTWLLEGDVLHQDSLGCEAVVRPGGVNVMTAGRGIAHAEQTPARNADRLNGVQLWVALPDAHRDVEPSFDSARLRIRAAAPGPRLRVREPVRRRYRLALSGRGARRRAVATADGCS